MGYIPKIIKGQVHDTGLPIDGCILSLSLWDWDNYESYHLFGWDDADDESVMLTMHKEDIVFNDMPIEDFKELWRAEEYEPDGVYCIPLDKVKIIEVIREEQKN